MVEQHIGRILLQNKSQQGHIDELRRQMASTLKAVDDLREEVGALQDCLVVSEVVRDEQVAASLHRRRFERILRRCAFVAEVLFVDVVHTPGVLHPILRCAGAQSLRHLAACSTLLRGGATMSQQYATWPTRLYLFGGSAGNHFPLASALRYDVERKEWQELAPMPTARDVLAAAAVGNQIYTVGGTDGERAFPTVECYDTDVGVWHRLQSMPTARGGLAVAAVDGSLYAVGGSNGTRALGTVETFDTCLAQSARSSEAASSVRMVENLWHTGPSLLTSRRGLAVAVMDRCLYAIGGSYEEPLDSVECLDTERHQWSPMPPMPTPRRAAAAAVHKGRIYVVGGASGIHGHGSSLSVTERFDPARWTWETLIPMPSARRGLSLSPVGGRLYALGGSDGARTYSAVEVFNPSTNMWEVGPPMPTRRGYFGAAVTQTVEVLGLTCGRGGDLRRALAGVCPLPR